MDRRRFLASSSAAIVGAVAGSAPGFTAGSKTKRCTLLHLTDTHAQLETHLEYLPGATPELCRMGGFARLKTAIDAQRATSFGPAFLVDGGDLVQGSGPAAWSRGEVMIAPSNALELDAFVPGNWEPIYGPEQFQRLMGRLRTRVIAYNFHHKTTGKRLFDPAVTVQRQGLKVSFVGIADPTTTERQPPLQVEGLDSTRLQGLRDFVKELRVRETPDLVVAVTHTGLTVSRQIAREIPEFDVILSGHTHERTERVIREGNVLVVEAGSFGSFLGRLDLTLKPDGGIDTSEFKLMPVAADGFQEDRSVAQVVDRALKPYRDRLQSVLGESQNPMMRYDVLETSADNLISDSLREIADTDIGLTNGFRFAPPIAAGPVSEGDLWNLLPMDSKIKRGWVTGRELKDYLERELELVFTCDPWKLSGGWGPRASGLKVTFEARAPQGKRLRSLLIHDEQVADESRFTIAGCEREGEPLDVVCRHRGTHDVEYSGKTAHESIRQYLASHPLVAPRRDGRARAVDLAEREFSQDKVLAGICSRS